MNSALMLEGVGGIQRGPSFSIHRGRNFSNYFEKVEVEIINIYCFVKL